MPERLECEVLQKVHYINTLTFTVSVMDGFSLTAPVTDSLDDGADSLN